MVRWISKLGWKGGLVCAGIVTVLFTAGCGSNNDDGTALQSGGQEVSADKASSDDAPLPLKGKVRAAKAPKNAVFGMIYVDSKTGAEWIYDGAQWVPHDATVGAHYAALDAEASKKAAERRAQLIQDEVCTDGDPACTPTGAHGKHGAYACTVCHKVGGRLTFDRTGPAYAAGQPAPSFDAVAKTCSNVACHSVPAGTFSYYFPGGDGEPVLNTVSYGGGESQTTPSWYAMGASCAACHSNPPDYPPGSGTKYVWHSGFHGGQGPAGTNNQCQLCHSDATGTNGVGTAITNSALHGNGVVNVTGRFASACFGCH